MLFKYKVVENQSGEEKVGTIEAINIDIAINTLQRKGFIISSIKPVEEASSFLNKKFSFWSGVKNKDIVILSRQIATLFQAQISALRVFRLLAAETPNFNLKKCLTDVADRIQEGSSIAKAMSEHSDIFSQFYVNMVRSGEESGKLDDTFMYLADYLDRTYEVTSKARNALVYPAFIIFVFFAVMILMFTVVIPKITAILTESGQELPIYTKIIIGISNFLVDYGIFLLIGLIIGGYFLFRYIRTKEGKVAFSKFKLSVPYLGDLFKKLYLSRFSDNMNTMLISGVPMLHALEVTSTVIDNDVFRIILEETVQSVKGGSPVSDALSQYDEMPGILIQMIKVGEESGQLGAILKTMADFYRREVTNSVDTVIGLIEPAMIIMLGVGVGILLASVLMPIYNISGAM